MAGGRMLKRNISDSRRLPDLQTDSARLLWTWILPYLDLEGRFYASPEMIKGKVVPRLKTFTEENIAEYLQDMARVGLITLYEVDGDMYMQYRKFKEFQTLRKDRERKPLPSPGDGVGITPGELLEDSGKTPTEIKLNEIKLNKAKGAPEEIKPVDNSQEGALLNEEENDGEDELKTAMRIIQEKRGHYYAQQCMIWLQTYYRNGNRRAVIHCLNQVVKGIDNIDHPKAYLDAAFKIENGKYNAADHDAAAQEFKKPLKPGELNALGSILAAIPLGKGK